MSLSTQCSTNTRIVPGLPGKSANPRASQKAWNIAPFAYCARTVFFEYLPGPFRAAHPIGRSLPNILDDAATQSVRGPLSIVQIDHTLVDVHPEGRLRPICRISSDWTPLISSEWDHPISG